jgi:hypothetical protein
LDLDGNTKLKGKAGHYGNDSSIVSNAVQFADRKFQAEKFNECLISPTHLPWVPPETYNRFEARHAKAPCHRQPDPILYLHLFRREKEARTRILFMPDVTARGRALYEYDQAAWHASDALQATHLAKDTLGRYIAHKSDAGWTVAFWSP